MEISVLNTSVLVENGELATAKNFRTKQRVRHCKANLSTGQNCSCL